VVGWDLASQEKGERTLANGETGGSYLPLGTETEWTGAEWTGTGTDCL
jgi:hypothetical protein